MIRVFVADDHGILRAGVRALVGSTPDIVVTGEAADGHGVLAAAAAPDWPVDVLVLDLSLPKISGVEVLRRVRKLRPSVRVLILSMYSEEQHARQTVELGAAGYVSKDRAEDELISAIRSVAHGRLHVQRSVAPARSASAARGEVSGREHQIVMLLVQGRTVTEIASELDVAVSTVSTYIGRIKIKLGLRTVGEIVGYAYRMGLVE
jgi:DNA-binding NarL/FixJ family response regulator